MFGIADSLSEKQRKLLHSSEEYYFYKIIFCNIDEDIFSVLYSSDKASRPNAPLNCMVSALMLKEKYNWTYEQLFKNINFNVLTKTALGLGAMDEIPFNDTTLFNFQNRLMRYYVETGVDLMENVFDKLTQEQLKQLRIKTNIQRSDSFMASSNIRSYSRLQLLIEVLLRLWRILDEEDKLKFKEHFSIYVNKTSGQYIYKLDAQELPREMEKIAELYHYCHRKILPKYAGTDYYRIFERVYNEHFTEVESKIHIKPTEELNSGCLQSPDDEDATFRKKRGESYRGQLINVTETSSPENEINLLTDVAVNPNNKDDSAVLNERIDEIQDKTPDLKELHTDGSYGSEDNDKKFEESGIKHVQTAVRGRQSEVEFTIIKREENKYEVECPYQSALSEPTRKRHKCLFNSDICKTCPLSDKCPAVKGKSKRTYYFTEEDYLRNRRNRSINEIPPERRKIRPNVEATVNEFSCRQRKKKLKVRGSFKTRLFAFSMAMAVNFGRIFRHITKTPPKTAESNALTAKIIFLFANFEQKASKLCKYFHIKTKSKHFLLKYHFQKKICHFLSSQKKYAF